ncbi:MAG: Hsp20/alpha crystallin family protein [Clostridiales bacterium]|nr:Hsp20/alpha crystallin family protein [Clostridiales bacterium]
MFELIPFATRRSALGSFDPFRGFEDLDRMFRDTGSIRDFKTDVKDTGDAFELECDLPGFKKEDIKVDLENETLTIKAERRLEKETKDDKNGGYLHRERSFGSFSRSFDVTGVNTEDIKCSYTDGVLKIVLPKLEEKKPEARHLEIV